MPKLPTCRERLMRTTGMALLCTYLRNIRAVRNFFVHPEKSFSHAEE
jgi:hypothetical protein